MLHSKEEKQQEKISKLQRQLEESKKKIKSLENKLSTSERKRKNRTADRDKKKVTTELYLYSLLNDINTLNL
jgi:predicted RNase H-like nuclease (RuvC/YqgF family)